MPEGENYLSIGWSRSIYHTWLRFIKFFAHCIHLPATRAYYQQFILDSQSFFPSLQSIIYFSYDIIFFSSYSLTDDFAQKILFKIDRLLHSLNSYNINKQAFSPLKPFDLHLVFFNNHPRILVTIIEWSLDYKCAFQDKNRCLEPLLDSA